MFKKSVLCTAGVLMASSAFAHVHVGMIITKEAPPVITGEILQKEMSDLTSLLAASKKAMDDQFKELTNHYTGVKSESDELTKTVKKHTDDYAAMVAQHQQLQSALDLVKKQLDQPAITGGDKLKDSDRKQAIELQRRKFIHKGGDPIAFREDTENLVDLTVYRRIAQKMMRTGIEDRQAIVRGFDAVETKAFEAAGMDSMFFIPEILGYVEDCNIECAYLLDMYGPVSVSKSAFMYPKIVDYGAIGKYDCDAKCDAEYGPEGNIKYLNGQTYDFRGVFCFQRKVLVEANYDLLGFMVTSIQRSYRINRNRALITGDGVNEPAGWLTTNCFPRFKTPEKPVGNPSFTHQDFRRFIGTAPVEYGAITTIMHQNMFAYLAALVDANGRFLFGDGLMTFSPDDVRERLRISNCLPDATVGNTLGGTEVAPFVAGSFLAATGNWDLAYKAVTKKPMTMEQFIGQSSMWCVKYQFGAEDGGFVGCCEAARILQVG